LEINNCKRTIKTGSNWLCKHAQCCRCHQNTQEYETDDLNPSSFKL